MGQVTVMSGPERRRRWSDEERLQILSDAFSPGACVAEVARRYDVSTALIYIWRRKLREAGVERAAPELASAGFAEAVIQDPAPSRRLKLTADGTCGELKGWDEALRRRARSGPSSMRYRD